MVAFMVDFMAAFIVDFMVVFKVDLVDFTGALMRT